MSYDSPPTDAQFKLVAEKIKEYTWFYRFLEQNPDIRARYEAHKTYEILNDDNGTR